MVSVGFRKPTLAVDWRKLLWPPTQETKFKDEGVAGIGQFQACVGLLVIRTPRGPQGGGMYQSVQATITKNTTRWAAEPTDVYSLTVWKFRIRVSAGLASPEASFLGLQVDVSSVCPHMVVPLHVFLKLLFL